jgi:outer membrane usher protein
VHNNVLEMRDRVHRILRIFRTLIIFIIGIFILTIIHAEASDTIIVDTIVNSSPKGAFFVILRDNGDFFIKVDDLEQMGFSSPGGEATNLGGESYVSLKSIEGVTYRFDEASLTLEIDAEPHLFAGAAIDFRPRRQKNVYYPRDSSFFLNYSLDYRSNPSQDYEVLTNVDELGIRQKDMLFLTSTSYTDSTFEERFTRLMTSLIYDDRQSLRRYTAGDLVTPSTGYFSSRVIMGGLSFSKLYKMDPYFVENPMLNITGHTAYPSEMEVYLDGARIKKMDLNPGEFQLNNLFYYGGARTVEVVLRDAFGREQRMVYPFYFNDTLLRRGLHEYSYNAGFMRENYGIESNEYGDFAFSAFHRYGQSDSSTLGFRAEGMEGLYTISPETSFRLGSYGTVTLTLSGSLDDGRSGMAGLLNYQYQNRRFASMFTVTGYTDDYATIAFKASDRDSNYKASAQVSYRIHDTSTISISAATSDTTRSQTAINYTRKVLRNTILFASLRNIQDDDDNTYEFLLGFNYYPWRDYSLSASYRQGEDTNAESVQIQKTPPVGEGYGYRVSYDRVEQQDSVINRMSPSFQYNSPFAVLRGEYIHEDINGTDTDFYHATGSGALVYIAKRAGLTRPVKDSFGLVKVGDLEGVTVYNNYQKIGRTDSDGTIIIPEMFSFYDNEIRIADNEIPMDYYMPVARKVVSPPYRSGSCMFFDLMKFQAYTGRLKINIEGELKPVEFYEILLHVDGDTVPIITGKGGEFYFENILSRDIQSPPSDSGGVGCDLLERSKAMIGTIAPGTYVASFNYDDRECSFEVTIPDSHVLEVDLGEIVCKLPQNTDGAVSIDPERTITGETGNAGQEIAEIEIENSRAFGVQTVYNREDIIPATDETTDMKETGALTGLNKVATEGENTDAAEMRRSVDKFLCEAGYNGEGGRNLTTFKEFTVHFPFMSSVPVREELYMINKSADFLKTNSQMKTVIEGHSDIFGPAAYNRMIGMKRAAAIKKRLLSLGVDMVQILGLTSCGEERLLCSEMTKECHRKNRRSVIRLLLED